MRSNLIYLFIITFLGIIGCSSSFVVKSDPIEAEVYIVKTFQEPVEENKNSSIHKSIETNQNGLDQEKDLKDKKLIGKTPLDIPMSELKNNFGEDVTSGEFFTISIEKKGYLSEIFKVPASRFGTMLTSLDIKLKKSEKEIELKLARKIIEQLFLAQKFALLQQYERAHIELDKILLDYPEFARAMTMRASIYFAQKNYLESLKWYDEALKIDPNLEDAVRMMAKVKVLQNGGRLPTGEKEINKLNSQKQPMGQDKGQGP